MRKQETSPDRIPRSDSAARCCSTGRVQSDDATTIAERGALAAVADSWLIGRWATPVGTVPRVSPALAAADHLGACRVRWGIRRHSYRIGPGLYALGAPTPASVVLVSANYKLSFDRLRAQLVDRDVWILVLDTKGVNVWCSAGKGTFGTTELVARCASVRLKEVIAHDTLVLPQLSATGICTHEVLKLSGFRVVFGPVRAEDLPAFLDAGLKATTAMRRVRFPLRDRIVLIPVEIAGRARTALLVAACLLLLAGLGNEGYSLARVRSVGVTSAALLLWAFLAGAILVPTLLPWLFGRPFSVKGVSAGVLALLGVAWYTATHPGLFANWVSASAWLFLIPATTSFVGMHFTGSSTYTSLSGVLKEMKIAVPLQIAAVAIAAGLWLTGLFL